ncbi:MULTISPECIES: M56 family metallopeptidase [unclassified Pedobacter]|uniref:M56 family metallopeptidase n=1 Tax=unclassified Pedobacter TaxID=2628915 RepID=UPI00141D886C|nr:MULTISPECIES: M56 family metallopeptidase [unclassified Pedobacter]NII83617.1 beta-lactamase regulating signal transducer with metallopeptidase domain [Pedobacter sp. SG908]NMN37478.1 beta-lactamase regulating signal transducer with metallopeptidase domain [Pedobacter sp. SG918]
MSWLYYLLEANLYLILFYGFYRLFLHRETFYALNRYYLIFSSVLAFMLPFFQLGFLKKEIVISYATFTGIPEKPSLFTIENGLLLLYAVISLVLILKICLGLRNLKSIITKAKKTKENGITLIEIENSKMAFSFFNFLFIDPELDQKTTILKHEMVHIRQKHSVDILLFELIQISSWFNPITYLIKNDIKLIHEYLADEITTNKDIAKYEYAMFLIQNSYGNQKVSLTNHFFNSSLLKNRISMLNQTKSAKWARLKLLFILPLTGLMLCLSTMAFTKDYGTIQLGQKKESLSIALQDTTRKKAKQIKLVPPPPPLPPNAAKAKKTAPKVEVIRFKPPVVKKDGKRLPPPVVIKDEKVAPPPPPVEPKPAKSGNDSETITGIAVMNDNNRAQSITSTSPAEQKELKSVTVVGYPSTGNKNTVPVKKVKGTKIVEVIVVGQPSKKQ